MVCTFYMYMFQVQAKMEEMGGGGVWDEYEAENADCIALSSFRDLLIISPNRQSMQMPVNRHFNV